MTPRTPEKATAAAVAHHLTIQEQYAHIQKANLKHIATLGVGGFGRVDLVYHDGDKTRTFALKALKKKHIVDTRQQVRIHTRDGERNSVRSVFFRKRKK